MTYKICKKLIEIKEFGKESKEDLLEKLDVFLLNNRITQEQYEELTQLLKSKHGGGEDDTDR